MLDISPTIFQHTDLSPLCLWPDHQPHFASSALQSAKSELQGSLATAMSELEGSLATAKSQLAGSISALEVRLSPCDGTAACSRPRMEVVL